MEPNYDPQFVAAMRSAIALTPEPLRLIDANEARRLVQTSGISLPAVAHSLGVSQNTVESWLVAPTAHGGAWQRFLSVLSRRGARMEV